VPNFVNRCHGGMLVHGEVRLRLRFHGRAQIVLSRHAILRWSRCGVGDGVVVIMRGGSGFLVGEAVRGYVSEVAVVVVHERQRCEEEQQTIDQSARSPASSSSLLRAHNSITVNTAAATPLLHAPLHFPHNSNTSCTFLDDLPYSWKISRYDASAAKDASQNNEPTRSWASAMRGS
jgi:hypothetical protein